ACVCVRTEPAPWCPLAVGEVGRDNELPLRADRHQLQRLAPALEELVDWKIRRSSFQGMCNRGHVAERPPVMDEGDIVDRWLWSVAGFQDLVLQAAFQRDDSLVLLVCGEGVLSISRVL